MTRTCRSRQAPCWCLLLGLLIAPWLSAGELRVMSFNIYGGGAQRGVELGQTIAAIRAARADIVGLQETRQEAATGTGPAGDSVAAAIAAALGWHCLEQQGDNEALWAQAVISRFPLQPAASNGLGVRVDLDGDEVFMINGHLNDYPYQPYQLLGIPYDQAPFLNTAEEAEAAATAARGAGLHLILAAVAQLPQDATVFVTGDFNEPSHRDWTAATVAAGRQPMAVHWPTVASLERNGFVDTWRSRYPDPVADPGFTWTPITDIADPGDHHDRIDYVLLRSPRAQILDSQVVGEDPQAAEIVVAPFPSDHRGVVSTVRLLNPQR